MSDSVLLDTDITAEIRRNAAFGGTQGAEEHRRTQGWLRQEVMPGGTSGEVMRRKITGGSDVGACAPG
ncbi:hypothetical protein RM69_09165 [Mesotoga sp. SC_NapDC3]|nr:hypothetical protein RM69_09165 [Mesotoga sp. SC_NapDC3]PXF34781.1 hypothetical protein EU77_05480 [Mesotoga sp. SC_NapDC]